MSTPSGDVGLSAARGSLLQFVCDARGRRLTLATCVAVLMVPLLLHAGQMMSTVGGICQNKSAFVPSARRLSEDGSGHNVLMSTGASSSALSRPTAISKRVCDMQGDLPQIDWPFANAVFDYLDASGVTWFGYGGWVLCVLRVGSMGMRVEGRDYFCDNDLDIALLMESQAESMAFNQKMREHFALRTDIVWEVRRTGSLIPYPGRNERVKNAYFTNCHPDVSADGEPIVRIRGVSPEPWVYPRSAMFPLQYALFNNRTVPVPRDPLRFFSFYRPYNVSASLATPEYGQGCMSLAYNSAPLFKMLKITPAFTDASYDRIRGLERGLRECARNLDALGYASFNDCFE